MGPQIGCCFVQGSLHAGFLVQLHLPSRRTIDDQPQGVVSLSNTGPGLESNLANLNCSLKSPKWEIVFSLKWLYRTVVISSGFEVSIKLVAKSAYKCTIKNRNPRMDEAMFNDPKTGAQDPME